MKIYVGIDPGAHGAIATVIQYEDYAALSTILDRDQLPLIVIANWLGALARKHDVTAAIEAVHAMPGQGVTSTFSFGRNFGEWLGIIAAAALVPVLVRPQDWRKAMGLAPEPDDKKRKAASRNLATRLWPSQAEQFKRVKDTDRAEAALIAETQRKARPQDRHYIEQAVLGPGLVRF